MKIYLDTNIIRDYLENRNPKSIELIERARQGNWECITSTFTMMELSDLQKDTLFFQKVVISQKYDIDRFLRERRQKALSEEDFKNIDNYLNIITTRLPFLKFANLSNEGWQIAQFIASHSCLSAVDVIHLSTAYSAGSEKVITTDTQFIKDGNEILKKGKRKDQIIICLPEKV